jgi:hypothetical protein
MLHHFAATSHLSAPELVPQKGSRCGCPHQAGSRISHIATTHALNAHLTKPRLDTATRRVT